MAVTFARLLRGEGLDIPLGSVVAFTESLGVVGLEHRDPVYWSGRATLVRRPEDVAAYDRVFAAFWLGEGWDLTRRPRTLSVMVAMDDDDEDDDGGGDEPGDEGPDADLVLTVRFSASETLRTKDFADYTAEEFDELRRLAAGLHLGGPQQRTRRQQPSARRSGRPDVRRTVRAALRSGGEPVRRHHQRPGSKPRRLVLLCDVSGSMESYARALLRFLHVAVAGRQRVEAFALGTRLTRLTRELSSRDPDTALGDAGRAVVDWSGGTRLGDGLRAFNDRWGVRGMARGAVVVILSDGWDRGDPEALAEQMARLQRVAHKVVWVNPLKASPGYAPLARGMAAALPYVDEFVEGHSLASLESLAGILRGEAWR